MDAVSPCVNRLILLAVAGALALAACTPNEPEATTIVGETPAGQSSTGESSTTDTARDPGPSYRVDLPPPDLYDPVRAGEQLPQGYRRSLPRDAIFPVYDPSFIAANETDWSDDILVIGIELEGEARAYPVGFLNRREIVIDDHRGIPTLVTW